MNLSDIQLSNMLKGVSNNTSNNTKSVSRTETLNADESIFDIFNKLEEKGYTIEESDDEFVISKPKGNENSQKIEEENNEDKDILSMTEDEVQNMSTEELIDVFRSDWNDAFFQQEEKNIFGGYGDINYILQNQIFFDLVNKMTDEQLGDFLETYKEQYGDDFFFGYKALESGVMWGQYAVAAGKVSKEDANSALQRLKEHFPELRPDIGSGSGIVQWA